MAVTAADKRAKNVQWKLPTTDTGALESWDFVKHALLMDIRDELQGIRGELQRLNVLLHCDNFQHIPRVLKRISANTYNSKKHRNGAS